jgi:formylglycine-generating enzyme required for sulfatase activity
MNSRVVTLSRLLCLPGAIVLLAVACFPGSPSAAQDKKATPKNVSVDLGGGVVMKLVGIKPGKFTMGTPKNEQIAVKKQFGDIAGNYAANETLHEVEITKPFYMGVYEVTQAEYEKVMGTNPSKFSPKGFGKEAVAGMDTSRFPVDSVSWQDAMSFCEKMSKRFKKKFDLPTEAEWEYACRAGTTDPFHFGQALSSKEANISGDSTYGAVAKGPDLQRTTKVGSYEPNAFGLYDLHGNVREWCKDWLDRGYYDKSPRQDPQGPADGQDRALRGGSWYDGAVSARSAARAWAEPSDAKSHFGFRVVVRAE